LFPESQLFSTWSSNVYNRRWKTEKSFSSSLLVESYSWKDEDTYQPDLMRERPRIFTMFPTPHFSALFFSLLAILPTFHAWQFSTTNVDLSSPPPINIGGSVVNGEVLANYTTSLTGWPCYNYPVPADVSRTPFPISGGRLSFILTNSSVGSLWDYQFIGDIYLGQISLGDGTYSTTSLDPSSDMNTGYDIVDTEVWDDFSSGQGCSDPYDVVGAISNALGKDVTAQSVVGMNATFGMRIVLFGPNPLVTDMVLDDNNVEEMYQVRRRMRPVLPSPCSTYP
jgi:hypothetical protein